MNRAAMQETIDALKRAREESEIVVLRNEVLREARQLGKEMEELDDKRASLISEEVGQRLAQAKDVEFYSQSLVSFYNTKIEKDKSILSLSMAGLGFLITFVNFGGGIDDVHFFLFVVSSLSFLVCIFIVVVILDMNANYIIAMVADDVAEGKIEGRLRWLDKAAMTSFCIGVFLSFCLGIAVLKMGNDGGHVVASNERNSGNNSSLNESVAGAAYMKKSFSEASKLKPIPSSGGSGGSGGGATGSSSSNNGNPGETNR